MLRSRARAGLTAVVVPLALLGGVLAGCGAAGGSTASADDAADASGPAPSEKALACRDRWKKVSEEAAAHKTATPSALPQRWVTVAATADYYATSATSTDCGDTLARQQKAISRLAAFSRQLQPYDLELALARVRDDADTYANSPRPKPSRERGRSVPAPAPASVGAALKVLDKQAPLASRQQGPAWQQAEVTELGDRAAVAKAVKDLGFLSQESGGYRAGRAALARITTATER